MKKNNIASLCVCGALSIVVINSNPLCKDCIKYIPVDPPVPDYSLLMSSMSPRAHVYMASVSPVSGSISGVISASPSPSPSE